MVCRNSNWKASSYKRVSDTNTVWIVVFLATEYKRRLLWHAKTSRAISHSLQGIKQPCSGTICVFLFLPWLVHELINYHITTFKYYLRIIICIFLCATAFKYCPRHKEEALKIGCTYKMLLNALSAWEQSYVWKSHRSLVSNDNHYPYTSYRSTERKIAG